ncbi:serine hydrolase [Polaromonas sp. A23]|uniref:serine hydrolase domain-containing protein n=1 Tax=Polaromonas sp. A23 TaxID=1944133 RepID=UPI00143B462D|nr:serine hydrolase domain-containing protein [Polaromonas sp. A23]
MKTMGSSFKRRLVRYCLGAVGALWLVAAGSQPLRFDADPNLFATLALGEEPGSVDVGVLTGGRVAYVARQNGMDGKAVSADASGAASQGRRIYEIGSISKVFTGLLVAQAVERGDLGLDDKLGVLLRGKVRFVSPEVEAITLRQLLTHSACVPRLPPDFSEDRTPENPYAVYNRQRLWLALGGLKLESPAPCAASYSNFGLGIVGEILSEHYGKPWHVLVRENITAPLGMYDTVQLLGDKSTRMAPAFNHAATAGVWDFQALAGAGALRSTAADMLIFSRAVMAGRNGPLGPAAERMLTPLGVFQSNRIGYAVMMRGPEGRRTYFHEGSTGGYRTLWMVAPDTQDALVVLTSNAHAQPGKAFVAITAMRYPIVTTPVAADAGVLAAYAGVFRVDKLTAFTFVPQDGLLYRRITGGGFRPMVQTGPDTFADTAFGVQYVFTRRDGAITGVDYTQGGGGMSGVRTGEAAPPTAVVPLDRQKDYVGRFSLDRTLRRPLDFDVKTENGQLAVRSGNWSRRPVFPVPGQADRFVYENPNAQLLFERDAGGKVVALVLFEGGVMRMHRMAD